MSRRVVMIVAIAVFAAVAVGLTVWLTRGDDSEPQLSHEAYAQLYDDAIVGKTRYEAVVEQWPKEPYQDFHDSNGNRCLEWYDEPVFLYDLCFDEEGVLANKHAG
jgi:hypothetical protein